MQATSKNNEMLGSNRVHVMLIPRVQVEAVLSSFGDDSSNNSQNNSRFRRDDGPPMNRNEFRPKNRVDWAPPEDFGKPDCIVIISNLSYRATIDDLLEEFSAFNLHPDQIIRHYNERDQPTGKACISFNSPEEAEDAIQKHNSVSVRGRPIWMRKL